MTSTLDTCNSTTTPLNISILKQSGKCTSKCEYSFKYQSSSVTVTNKGSYISLAYDSSNSSPVKYNSHDYNVKEIRIYSPSAHTYMGQQAPAEIVIIHTPVSGGNNLIVSVPVRADQSALTSKGSTVINAIILTKIIPQDINQSATLNNIKPFTLNDIVPNKPFFSYSGQDTFYNCSQTANVDYIVFTPLVSNISISQQALIKLNKLITNSGITAKQPDTNTPLFVNENGPSNFKADEGIYIDCQPVGKSSETQDVVVDTNYDPSPISARDIFENPWIQFIGISILILILIWILSSVIKAFGPISTSMSNSSRPGPIKVSR